MKDTFRYAILSNKNSSALKWRNNRSQIDMDLLLSGVSYSELPDSYVIFICDYDPCEKGKYMYTFRNWCKEDASLALGDGSSTIYLSTCGKNEDEVPKELVNFLKYVKADLNESVTDFEDNFVKKLQDTVREIKTSREMEERYMLLEELLKTERSEGKEEGRIEGKIEAIFDILEDLGAVPDKLREQIENETDISKINSWFKAAVKAESIDQFAEKMQ